MLALEARFALLVLFCSLSMQWLAPISGVSAAAISRQPASRRSSSNAARYYQGTSPHSQRVLPWSRHHGRGRGSHHKRMASNPFSKFAEEVLSGFKNKFHHKRSHKAIVIPSNHGDAYLVSHARRASTPLWGSTNQTSTSNGTSASTQSQDLPMGAVPGTMAIASPSGDEYKTIASLFGEEQDGKYVFGASDTNQTQLYLVPASNAATRELTVNSSQESTPVTLVFLTETDARCLTFDPNPGPDAQVMTGEKCHDLSAEDVDTTHSSQTFSYDKTLGVVRPTWFLGQEDGTTNTTTAQDVAAAAAAASASESANSTDSTATDSASGAAPTSTALGSRDAAVVAPRPPQNVTLIFVPNNRAAAADVSDSAEGQAQSSVSASASASGAASAAAVTPSSASTSGVVSAAAVAPSSASASGVVSAAAVAQSSASASGAVSAAAVAPSSASGSFSSAPAPSQTAAGLSVELVGGGSVPQPAAPLSLSAPSAPSPAAAQSSSAPAAAQSVNAAAVPPTQSSSSSSSSSAPAPSLNAAAVSAAQSSSSSAPAQSVNAAAVAAAQSSSSAAAPSPSVNAAAVAASIASSASASSASASGSAAAASVDSSAPSASASATSSGTPSATFVAAVMQREAAPAMTPVSTDPYVWKFQADSR